MVQTLSSRVLSPETTSRKLFSRTSIFAGIARTWQEYLGNSEVSSETRCDDFARALVDGRLLSAAFSLRGAIEHFSAGGQVLKAHTDGGFERIEKPALPFFCALKNVHPRSTLSKLVADGGKHI